MKSRWNISLAVIVIVLAVPSLTYAAWWNPLTWFKKPTTPPVAKVVQVATTTPTTKPVVAIPLAPVMKKEVSAPLAKPIVATPAKTADQFAEIEKLRKEVEALKKKQSVQDIQKEPVKTERQTYPIIPGDLSSFSSDQQTVGIAAYNEFRQIPDLQYLTPQQQNELFKQIAERHVVAYATLLRQQVQERQDELNLLIRLNEQQRAREESFNKIVNDIADSYRADIISREKELSSFSQKLDKCKEDIKKRLQDVGISESQYNRLVASECY